MNVNIIGKTIGTLGQEGVNYLARIAIEKKVSPNGLKGLSFISYSAGGILLACGTFARSPINWIHILAGLLICLAGLFDLVNEAVVRLSDNARKFRTFTYSILDCYADMIIFTGAIFYFALRQETIFVVISALALVGTVMMSYTSARAEALFPGRYDSGYLKRPERLAVLIITSIVNRLWVGMALIAILANLATFYRVLNARQTAFNLEHPQQAGRRHGSTGSPAMLANPLLGFPY